MGRRYGMLLGPLRQFSVNGAEYEFHVEVEEGDHKRFLVVELHTVPRTPSHLRAIVLPLLQNPSWEDEQLWELEIREKLRGLVELCVGKE